jgi:hypothetical protein
LSAAESSDTVSSGRLRRGSFMSLMLWSNSALVEPPVVPGQEPG